MYNISDFDHILSRDNDRVKLYSKLDKSKYRHENKLFLAEGVKLTNEALDSRCAETVLICESVFDKTCVQDIIKKAEGKAHVIVLSDAAFGKITTESAPQGVISVCNFPDSHHLVRGCSEPLSDDKRIIVLDGVRDPGNLGTMLRCAVAFGIDAVVLGDCADVYSPKTVRAAMGAVFKLELVICDLLPEYLETLKHRGRRLLGAALSNNNLVLGNNALFHTDAVVIGNEGHGISDEVLSLCDGFLRIPMEDGCESLNAAVAASVIMWELYKLGSEQSN